MALETLSKTGITNGQTIQSYHVTQSIDALTGTIGYALTVSGSFTFIGSTTGSGYFANSVNADKVKNFNLASDKGYSVPYIQITGSAGALGYTANQEGDGTTMFTYNPLTNLLQATASYATSASQAISASYAPPSTPTSYNPSYILINDFNNTSSGVPYTIDSSVPSVIYISQSVSPLGQQSLGLLFNNLAPQDDGKIITFNAYYDLQAPNLNSDDIYITSSGANIFGLGGVTIAINGDNTLTALGIANPTSFDCQWVNGGGGLTQGWYFIKKS